jgi:CRP/FNR family transcriptional regulator, cyclic AMP receptor protein
MARRVPLLDVDPDLSEGLEGERRAAAQRGLVVRVERVDAGRWTPEANAFDAEGGLGLIVVEGMALRRVALGHRAAAELLGPGDVMRPWEDDGEHAAYPFEASFRILEPLTLAVIDHAVMVRLMLFPEIVTQLMARVMARSRRVIGHLVIAQLPSVDARLHVLFWHLAERFGRVRVEGVSVPLSLTHETLGMIVGAHRPAVTTALGQLVERGQVEPLAGGGWLLKGEPPETIAAPRRQSPSQRRDA